MQYHCRARSGWWLALVFAALLMLTLLAPLVSERSAGAQTDEDLNCADFPSQAAAQRELEQDRSDPNNLDADNDGQACEDFDYDGSGAGGRTAGGDQYTNETGVARGAADNQYAEDHIIGESIPNKGKLANTGGAPLILLLAGAALLSMGLLLGRYVIQRS